MQLVVCASRSRLSGTLALCTWLFAACSAGDDGRRSVAVPPAPDAGAEVDEMTPGERVEPKGCVDVELEEDVVIERLEDFTARFELGAPYARTVMLFGGMPVEKPNTPTRAYIFGLDKVDAQMMAKKYPDFYLCSSIGGQEAAAYIRVYDIVPATCKVHQQLVAALKQYDRNAAAGGDRTSLYLEGSPLTVTSVTQNMTGEDVSDQVSDQQFHLITAVQQLTGESLLNFGASN